MVRMIGAALIVAACGGCGFSMAASHRREEHTLRQILRATEYMDCELQFRHSPLPELCRGAAGIVTGPAKSVFSQLCDELSRQDSPSASLCMAKVLADQPALSIRARMVLSRLGDTLGLFDLSGQHRDLEAVAGLCRKEIESLSENRAARLRSYQTLGLCAGAALVILFI